jgi:hypothetical protein
VSVSPHLHNKVPSEYDVLLTDVKYLTQSSTQNAIEEIL